VASPSVNLGRHIGVIADFDVHSWTSRGHRTGDCYIGKKDTTLYSFSGLFDTLTGVLRDMFECVSDIAQKMLARDAMSISVISEDAGLVISNPT
jgi:hypothetical protein